MDDKKQLLTMAEIDAGVDDIINRVIERFPNYDRAKIREAYEFAKELHYEQKRKSGEPYIMHPVEVARICVEFALDPSAVIACILHDVVEDTTCTIDEVRERFGDTVAELVDGVTKLTKLSYTTHEEQQIENLRKMFLAMSKDIRVVLIKLIDRLHNMRTLEYQSKNKQHEKARETLEVYAPLAHRLGMSKLKSELEDLSLFYIDPVSYHEIEDCVHQAEDERQKYVDTIKAEIASKLDELHIKGTITGRAKHYYSIFRKMYFQHKTIEEIYDLFAVRVIVDTVADCYAVLGMVHELYTPVPGRVKDYIAMPKPNMYQSLHTTVIGKSGAPFEIQIRTWEMHHIAETGIAAHWKYKEGTKGEDLDSKLEWVRQLIEMSTNTLDSDDFFNTLKIDLFADEVFVFTPQGKVINLPAKSNVIDFAFAIHSEVGYKMSGAKVNGKIVNNNYILQNGEIVEILANNTHGPSRDWLKLVRTNQAKNKINQWFKKQNREENIERGKTLVEKELRRIGYTHTQLFREEWVARILRRYSFSSIDDLYASIGYGGLTAQKVVLRLRDDYRVVENEEKERERLTQLNHVDVNSDVQGKEHRASRNNGIVVKGIDNCLVRLAGCCNPVPGDEVVGFITKGRGVSVHRGDCPNVRPIAMPDRDRFVDVEWEVTGNSTFITNIQIEASDRDGLVVDISMMIANIGITCKSINAFVNKKGNAIVQMGLEIRNQSDITKLSKKFKTIPDVINVSRFSN